MAESGHLFLAHLSTLRYPISSSRFSLTVITAFSQGLLQTSCSYHRTYFLVARKISFEILQVHDSAYVASQAFALMVYHYKSYELCPNVLLRFAYPSLAPDKG